MSAYTRPAFAVDRSYVRARDEPIPYVTGSQVPYAVSINGALLVASAWEGNQQTAVIAGVPYSISNVLNVAVRLDRGSDVLWTLLMRIQAFPAQYVITEAWLPFASFQTRPHATLRFLEPVDEFNTSTGVNDGRVTNALCDGPAFVPEQLGLFGDGGPIHTLYGDANPAGNLNLNLFLPQQAPAQRLTLNELKIRQHLYLV